MYRIPYENEQITKTIAAPYAPVDFTEEEKEQFRENIGAGTDSASETELLVLKMLGWTVPKDFAVQNYEENGVFHQRVGRVDLGILSWTTAQGGGGYYYHWADVPNRANGELNLICSKYITRQGSEEKTIRGNAGSARVYIFDSSYTSASAFKSAMNGVYLYYELATEITHPVDGYEVTEPPVLLWENASPTSTFTSQTIPLDLSKYRQILVTCDKTTSARQYSNTICNKGQSTAMAYLEEIIRFRNATMSDNGVYFSGSYVVSSYGSATSNSGVMIPFRIYGIK